MIQKLRVVQGELTDLKGHLANDILIVEVQKAQVPLHGLNRIWEVNVEAEHLEDFLLHIYHVLADYLSLLLNGKKPNHAFVAW